MALSKRKGDTEAKDKKTQEALLGSEKGKGEDKTKTKTGEDEKEKDKVKKGSAWKGWWKKMKMLWPFMWPKGNLRLQIRVFVSLFVLLLTRGVSVLIPLLYREIVNSMTIQAVESSEVSRHSNGDGLNISSSENTENNDTDLLTATASLTATVSATTVAVTGVEFRWDLIVLFIIVKTLHGSNGYLNCLRSFLWIRVSQNTRKKMRLKLFAHLHSLSIRWHLTRKTGEVLRVMDRGVDSINLVLSQMMFNIAPVMFDIAIAVVFFITMFNVWTGLIVFATMTLYMVFTVMFNEWRTKYRRKMNAADNQRNAASVDSIINFETVKYYAAEDWEVQRYSDAVDEHQKTEFFVTATLNLLNSVQKTVMMVGLLGGSLLTAWYVAEGKLTVGDYVLFASYVEQLYGPLTNFGAFYRIMQNSFVDMENMLDMLKEEVEVQDAEDAKELVAHKGAIEFKDVCFYYNEKKPILKNISFSVPPGKTYALVGESGGGKSTVVRLLLRFYNIQSGCITIDGQDISKVTQKSLRLQVGVVPQDTTLFNTDLRYNIQYGRVGATDEDVEESAKAADIHDRILTFPDGYESKVGERGLKLSGGEKQRVAIARTILKGPEIVLLDEATSALDTKTERNIQASLARLCQNKTTIVVAHRLSTIINADTILVVKDGEICETGTHEDLLELDGIYAEMWHNQLEKGELDDSEGTAQPSIAAIENGDPATVSPQQSNNSMLDKDSAFQNSKLGDQPAKDESRNQGSVSVQMEPEASSETDKLLASGSPGDVQEAPDKAKDVVLHVEDPVS